MNEELDITQATEHGREKKSTQWINIGLKRILPLAAVLLVAFLGVYAYNLFFPPNSPLSQNEIDQRISQALASATPPPAYSTTVYQTILPSLVYIQAEGKNEGGDEGVGIGSGVVINEAGDILTALHVVANSNKIEIYFADSSQSVAEIIAMDPDIDIAVLHPHEPPELIVPAILGSSSRMRVGDEAFAVGNPFGLVASMSSGVISGFDRSFTVNEDEGQRMEGLIQFDTAVNPGNSGGPLLNRQGQVIGIVTALANPSDMNFFIGIGFAVPIGTAVSAGGGGPSY